MLLSNICAAAGTWGENSKGEKVNEGWSVKKEPMRTMMLVIRRVLSFMLTVQD